MKVDKLLMYLLTLFPWISCSPKKADQASDEMKEWIMISWDLDSLTITALDEKNFSAKGINSIGNESHFQILIDSEKRKLECVEVDKDGNFNTAKILDLEI